MQRFLLICILILPLSRLKAQNSFFFNCRKDIIIDCSNSCTDITTTIPDIHAATNSYFVTQVNCYKEYVDPQAAGTSANLVIDDRYSSILDIGFPFSFFGST